MPGSARVHENPRRASSRMSGLVPQLPSAFCFIDSDPEVPGLMFLFSKQGSAAGADSGALIALYSFALLVEQF
jgi:hypothetical protein